MLRKPIRLILLIILTAICFMAVLACDGSGNPEGTGESTSASAEKTESPETAEPTSEPTPEPTAEPTPEPTPEPDDVVFSHKGGYYTEPVDIVLEAPKGGTIYYTRDGTAPTTESSVYSEPIHIKKNDNNTPGPVAKNIKEIMGIGTAYKRLKDGTVIRAIAVTEDGKVSDVYTQTYFVWAKGAETYGCPVISLSLEFDDFATKNGIYFTTMQSPFTTKRRVPAFCEIYDENGEKQCGQYVQISLSGNGSLGNLEKSVRIYFKKDAEDGVDNNPGKLKYDIFNGKVKDSKGKTVTEFKRLLLRNAGNDSIGSFMADKLSQKVSEGMHVDYQESRTVLLLINGEMWGCYNCRERFDAKYFAAHYGILEENFCMVEAPTPLKTGNGYSPYELCDGEEGDDKPWQDLVKYIRGHDMSKDEYYSKVTEQLDIDSLIDSMVCHMYTCNGDWPWNNIKVWRNKSKNDPSGFDTKWHFVIMDMDGGFISDVNTNMLNHAINDSTVLGSIANALMKNPAFKEQLLERCLYAVETQFTKEKVNKVLDEMIEEMTLPIGVNYIRWECAGMTKNVWTSKTEQIRDFAAKRPAIFLKQVYAYFGVHATALSVSFDPDTVSVKINGRTVSPGDLIDGAVSKSAEFKYEITLKDGYTLSSVILTEGAGTQKEMNELSGTVKISKESYLYICTLKTDASLKPEPMISAGSDCALILTADGRLFGYGTNRNNALGLPADSYPTPKLIMTGVYKVATAQGGSTGDSPFTYVITTDGRLFTCGTNSSGQLAREGNCDILLRAATPEKIIDVSCGYDHGLILTASGKMYGIGCNSYKQIKNTSSANITSWTQIASDVSDMAAGRRHTLWIRNGNLYALGDNRWTKITRNASEVLTVPTFLANNALKVYAGEHSSLYIDTSNRLYYFGSHASVIKSGGVAGTMIHVADNISEASMQDGHIVMTDMNGNVYACGSNSAGEAGDGGSEVHTPALIGKNAVCSGAGTGYSLYYQENGYLVTIGKFGKATFIPK